MDQENVATPEKITCFEVSVTHPSDGVCVVAVSGEVDLADYPAFRDLLTDTASRSAAVVVDLSWCDFIDSSGIRALLAGSRAHGRRNGGNGDGHSFAIVAPGGPVRRVLELTRMDRVIPLHDDVEGALAA